MIYYLPTDLINFANRTGRWCLKSLHQTPVLYTTNLGSYLRCQVADAHQLKLHVLANQAPLSPSQIFAIRLNGHHWQRYPAKQGTIKIALTPAAHTIEIMTAGNTDLDQVWTGNEGFAITAIELDQGQLQPAAPRPVIDFIGDSITAGCWVTGKHASYDYRPESNYAGICTDLLGVDSVRIAYSAGGVLRPATGGVPTADQFLPKIDAATNWTPNQPDLVVINLGVNDRRFPLAQFKAAFDLFMQQVQLTFPQTRVAVMIPFSQTFADEIRLIVKQHHCLIVETAGWCQSFTDGLHPDQIGATTGGQQLAKFLRPLLSQSSVQ